MLCKQCLSGFSPRNVTRVMPLRCLFCDDTLQTWYIYQSLGKMSCTNCEAVKHIDKPLWSEECSKCGVYYEEGLLTYADVAWCEDCFRLQLVSYNLKKG